MSMEQINEVFLVYRHSKPAGHALDRCPDPDMINGDNTLVYVSASMDSAQEYARSMMQLKKRDEKVIVSYSVTRWLVNP